MDEAGVVLPEHKYEFAHIVPISDEVRAYEDRKAIEAARREQELLEKTSVIDVVLAAVDGVKNIASSIRHRFAQKQK